MNVEAPRVEEYLPILRKLAGHVVAGVGPTVDIEDLVSAGAIALLRARKRYDPSRGWSFGTFVWRRVRGAMVDELRVQCDLRTRARRKLTRPLTGFEADPRSSVEAELEIRDELEFAMRGLSRRERGVLWARAWGFTLREVGDAIGLTGSGAARLQETALSAARNKIRERGVIS